MTGSKAPSSSSPAAVAWDDQTLADPHAQADKAARVQSMFDAIATSYDLNNRLHSLGMDQRWRRAAVRLAAVKATDDVLDVACGTGDLALAFAEAGPRSVQGVDFTPRMIEIARIKARRRRDERPESNAAPLPQYRVGDAMALEQIDESVDIVSIAFGIRNVSDPGVALQEFRRVLRPGGRLIVLEFGLPANPVLRGLYRLYFEKIMPLTATIISRDRTGAYRYLPRSVSTFISRDRMSEMIREAGFSAVEVRSLTFGVCLCYVASV